MSVFHSVEAILVDIGLPSTEQTRAVVDSALQSAVQELGSKIQTDGFDRVDAEEYFWVSKGLAFRQPVVRRQNDFDAFAHTGGGSAFFRPTPGRVDIALSRGFLDTGQTYTIRAASERTDLVSASSTDYLNVRVAPDGKDHALVDADKGWLRITDLGLDRCYVRVTYKAGFLTDLGCPAIFGEGAGSSTPVPTWLKEAAKLQVLVNLAHHPVVSRDTGRDAREIAEEIKKDREDTLNRILAQRTRAMPMGHGSVLEATVTASAT